MNTISITTTSIMENNYQKDCYTGKYYPITIKNEFIMEKNRYDKYNKQ